MLLVLETRLLGAVDGGQSNDEHSHSLIQFLADRGVRCSREGLERYLGAPVSVGRQSTVFEFVCGGLNLF